MLRDRGNVKKKKKNKRKIAYHLQTNPNKNNATSHQKKKKKKGSQKALRHQSTGETGGRPSSYILIYLSILYIVNLYFNNGGK